MKEFHDVLTAPRQTVREMVNGRAAALAPLERRTCSAPVSRDVRGGSVTPPPLQRLSADQLGSPLKTVVTECPAGSVKV